MITTPTVDRNLSNVKIALHSSRAILLQGEIGCGKSLAIQHLAEQCGMKETMIQVNVDDTFDSKDLLGKFSATEVPGAFEWVPGPLTLAVEKGYWILMEDIDLASFDVFSVILSLLENSTLFISDKNRIVDAHPNFKLIATQQLYTSGSALLARKSNAVPYAELWGTAILESLPADEVCTIVKEMYPVIPSTVVHNLAALNSTVSGAPLATLRNLLRWSRRVSKRLTKSNTFNDYNNNSNTANSFMSSTVREVMLKEAFDCFVAKNPPGSELQSTLAQVSTACGVPENVAEPLVLDNKPVEVCTSEAYQIGRVTLALTSMVSGLSRESRIAFAPTRTAMSLLEKLAAAVESKEHVLLTGETGVGKTFIVQYLADQLGQNLIVHNLNQQTDTSDFMGGWKPLDVGIAVREVYNTFTDLFATCFNAEKNVQFLDSLQQAINGRKWDRTIRQMIKGCGSFKMKNEKTPFDEEMQQRWRDVEQKAEEILDTVEKTKTNFAFFFEEGSLVTAWREGHWILLDELNLATNEVLERVSTVLGDVDRLFLTDKGNAEPIMRHPNFHVFANMNPPTDVGKKDLPPSLRSRFTECYVSEPFNRNDINIVVREYIGFLTPDAKVDEITQFFLDCVEGAKTKLCALDGESKPPSFSLRTLTRALSYVRKATMLYGFGVALFDGLLLGFATPLQRQFHEVVEQLIVKNIFKGKRPQTPVLPPPPQTGNFIAYEHLWVPAGHLEAVCDEGFILTDSVRGHLTNLARAVYANRPVLLEGPTSSGKSSMVKYLADLTGNKFVRINNHDSTEVQEYLGHYVTDEYGKLRFVDGILVNAVRHGYWVVLDELNLAPTDVLEALNRLLDDNCELFIPDTQETVKPHPQLRIFATQNPAGIYGGRKLLSRAFRNRFLEITVDEIPTREISTILQRRYALPESFAERMVEVLTALQIRRQNSQIFAGRHGFITPRDLFRWAERKPTTYQELAEHGFLLLGERCRKPAERQIVKDVMEQCTKTELDEKALYHPSHWPFVEKYYKQVESGIIDEFKIVWTESMQRLFTIVGICLENLEPVLLVGETGSSKTTVCQLWAALLGVPLHILNCHQHTEAADFLGSLRPVPPDRRDQALFEWRNGPLVQSMINGDFFVLDEISLTEDSVLERLNSVLEPSRSVTLAEKSSADCIVAHERFRVMATMNPGGDFGKKELSPALRNRFTEIYVRPTTDEHEIATIISKRMEAGLETWAPKMAAVLCNVANATAVSGGQQHVSIRDIIGWVSFMNSAHDNCPDTVAFMQGLYAVILDGIGVGTGQSEASGEALKQLCASKAKEVAGCHENAVTDAPFWEFFEGMSEPVLPPEMQNRFFFGAPATRRNLSKLMRASIVKKAVLLEGSPGVGKTSIVEALGCAMGRPVVRINLSEQTDIMDLFGTYLPCPTSDDGNVSAAMAPQFAWSDGVLLRALKEGSWVILDELNLASQSVLEGLNALLDHRSTVFIPELNEEFHAHADFRVFACQNPLVEGGGRKGLPRSFLNRFLKVRIEPFATSDLICIAKAVCGDIEEDTLRAMVGFVGELQVETMVCRSFGARGAPWEFNLRDVLRWAKLLQLYDERSNPTYFADVLFVQRMRSEEDRRRCTEALCAHFSTVTAPDPRNSDFLICDDAIFFDNRRIAYRVTSSAAPSHAPPQLLMLPSQTELVRSLLLCAEQSQFALLIGPSGSGKTFALHTAAALAGAKLMTFSMNASCDTVDLLGGFDQVEGKQGQFEWRDSLVLEAMVHGHWLVLDNVNYCNASVLDRLNPLVEPNGVLSVNEQGLVNNEIRVIRPHPKFRLFATLNPRYGEISRAMRNRAVELYVAPVAIPSVESAALCHAATRDGTIDEELLRKLGVYHRTFVRLAFGADTARPTSALLCDALSAGAPNVFTLVRGAAMLPRDGSATAADLERAVLHRYIVNRSGHWRHRREELVELLSECVQKSLPLPEGDALATAAAEAMQLLGTVRSNSEASEVLVELRALRAGLPLRKLTSFLVAPEASTEGGDDSEALAISHFHQLEDVLVAFILDQCADSVQLESLAAARMRVVSSCLAEEELCARVCEVVDVRFATSAALPLLFCRTMQILGPHARTLALANSVGSRLSESILVNESAVRALFALQRCLDHATVPAQFQLLLRTLVHFLRDLQYISQHAINSENFVPVVTKALLLRSLAMKQPALDTAFGVSAGLEEFLDALRKFLDLPFPLIGGRAVLYHHMPQPHITTPEERGAFRQWEQLSIHSSTESGNTPTGTSQKMLRTLWLSAAFRAEFALVQLLLRTHGSSISAQSARLLHESVAAFVTRFTKSVPLFTELEQSLWRGLLALPTADMTSATLGQFVPLLVSQFVVRYGPPAVRLAFTGTWTAAARACVHYASQVSVMSIGNSRNEHAQTMEGLGAFLAACPVAPRNPFAEWERNARTELRALLACCFPDVAAALSDMDVSTGNAGGGTAAAPLPRKAPATAAATSSKDRVVMLAVRGVVANPPPSLPTTVQAQRSLIATLLNMLEDPQCNMLAAIALLYALKCRLLLPETPVDPMYRRESKMQIATEELALLERLLGAFAWAEQVMMRASSTATAPSQLLDDLRTREEALLRDAKLKYVPRPDSTGRRYASLVRELYQLCGSLLSDERLRSVTGVTASSLPSSVDAGAVFACENWSELLFQQVRELLEQYDGYEDVTLNFAEAALMASLAARASCYAAGAVAPSSTTGRDTLFSISQSLQLLEFPRMLAGSLPLPNSASFNQLQHRVAYLDSCLVMLRGSVPQGTDRAFVEGLFSAYRDVFNHVEELEERERKAEETAVLYKEKAVVIEGDDEKILRQLKELFPSYEKDFLDVLEDPLDEAAADGEEASGDTAAVQKKRGQSSAVHARIMFKERDGDYVRRLVAAHREFYARLVANTLAPSVQGNLLLESFEARFDAVSSELHRFGDAVAQGIEGTEERLLMSGFSFRRARLQARLRETVTVSLEEKRDSGFNIFRDTDPSEVARFSKPLGQLLARVDELAALYPDTITLQRCQRVGRKVAALPALTTPLMKVMAGCEVLLRQCYEWERNASHEVSIMTHITELSSFVLRWRRLELHCWPHVFQAKRGAFELRASLQWFQFYDLVREEFGDADIEAHCRNAFNVFSQFMWSACYGDYSARLRLIESFGYELISTHGYYSPLSNVALHVSDFFAQFEPFLLEQCRKAIEPIEDDIAEFTKIMLWEDANYYAVRATAEKSHLKMARVLSSLDEALRTPVLSIITAEEERCEEDPAMGFVLPPEEVNADGKRANKKKSKKQLEKEREEQRKAAKGKRNRTGRHITFSPSCESVTDGLGEWDSHAISAGYEFMDSSSVEVIERVKALQAPKVPNQMKIRALKTFFDVMRESGVPHTHENMIKQWEVVFATTETMLACRSVYVDQQHSVAQLSTAAQEHYHFARWLQRMRDVERKPNQDLSGAQVKRGTGLAESLFAHSVSLVELVCSLFKLQEHLGVLRVCVDGCSTQTGEASSLSTTASDIQADCVLLDACVNLYAVAQSIGSAFDWMQNEKLVDERADKAELLRFQQTSVALSQLCAQHEVLRRAGASLPAPLKQRCFAALHSMHAACSRLSAGGDASVAAAALVLQRRVEDVLAQHDIATPSSKRHRSEAEGGAASDAELMPKKEDWAAEVQTALARLGETLADDSIAVSSPVVASSSSLPAPVLEDNEKDADDEESDGDAAGASTGVYAVYHAKCTALKDGVAECAQLLQSAVASVDSRACLQETERSELLQRLSLSEETVRAAQQALITVLTSHSKLGVVVTRLFTVLMKKGFCKTEENDEGEGEGEGEGEQKNGTGMDDGEGEKDVTDQMENEDQLMNMKDKEEQPEDQKNKEDEGDEGEDNAADVETDFQGQKEGRDESEEDGDEEGEESDKEMGSVDGEDEQERKKTRKDNGDDNDMDEDEGGDAQEVPEDELGAELDKDEETGGFADKEEEIREAEEEREGSHEMVGDDKRSAMDDDDRDSADDDDTDGDSIERSLDEEAGEERDATDEELDTDDDRMEERSEASEDRVDDDASTDMEKSVQDERELETDQQELDDAADADVEDASDAADENVYEGGRQDEKTGEEATERPEDEEDKRKPEHAQQDAAGTEEQQPGDEQEQDDAGRNWKRQQEENRQAQRRDNTERNRSQHNPYKAIKEALQRHQQQMQQLNLDKNVEIKDDDRRDEAKEEEKQRQNDEEDIEDFEFDEQGDREGMAATEERQTKPTEAEEEADVPDHPNEQSEEDFDTEAEAPQDSRRKRKNRDKDSEEVERKDEADESAEEKKEKKKKKSKSSAKVRARRDEEDEEEPSGADEKEAADEGGNASGVDEKLERGRRMWQEQEAAVQGLSQQLCEQLRLILAPTLADKLQGDYKTGKRLNMKRIIPYIASQFKKDRIWLRRTRPNKRTYQIMVALDDSLSMQCNNAGVLSCRAVALIAKALQQLEVGEIGITCFGKETQIVHPFEEPFAADSGPRVFSEVTFNQKSTNLKLFLETVLDYMDTAAERMHGQTRSTTQQLQQIMFVISDGQITEDRPELRKLLARAEENHQMVVFVLLDLKAAGSSEGEGELTEAEAATKPKAVAAPLTSKDLRGLSTAERMRRLKMERDSRLKRVQSNSILDMQLVEFKNGKVERRAYMEDFPFSYYLIVRELQNLPEVIADAMRQWFELLNAGVQ